MDATTPAHNDSTSRAWFTRTATPMWTLLFLVLCSYGCSTSVKAQQEEPAEARPITFLSIVQDEDTATADMRLKRFLELAVATGSKSQHVVRFGQEKMSYSEVIRRFAEREQHEPGKAYLARITPYAYVAAEMLGADLRILGIYKSAATGGTTYNSYFVVRKDALETYAGWKPDSGDPTLENVKTYLKELARQKQPARFVYHDRFSTSSYFLPSLYFKSNQILAVDNWSNENFIPIQVQRSTSTSSTELVNQVWRKDVELAAVWDGTKKKFDEDSKDPERVEVFRDVAFIPNPSSLPNDFLVASGIGEAREAVITQAIKGSPGAGRVCTDLEESFASHAEPSQKRTGCSELKEKDRPRDDFDAWYVWDSNDSEVSDAARKALARLRQDARQRPLPVVVRVEPKGARRPPATCQRGQRGRSAVGNRIRPRGPGPARARGHDLDAGVHARWRPDAHEHARLLRFGGGQVRQHVSHQLRRYERPAATGRGSRCAPGCQGFATCGRTRRSIPRCCATSTSHPTGTCWCNDSSGSTPSGTNTRRRCPSTPTSRTTPT